jgi:transposase InsO family protein
MNTSVAAAGPSIEIKEVGSGASVRELRQKLLAAARRRDIDVVIVWRQTAGDVRWTTLQELRDLDVGFVSLTEALDLTTHSAEYVALLRQYGLQLSMSAKGNPYDNAYSWNRSTKL